MKLKTRDTPPTTCANCEMYSPTNIVDTQGPGWCEMYQCATRGIIAVCEFRAQVTLETLVKEIEKAYQTWNKRIYHARASKKKTTSKYMRRVQRNFWD